MSSYEEQQRAQSKGLSVFRLKMIGFVLLAIGTLSSALVMRDIPDPGKASMGMLSIVVLCEAISWIAIPIYAWLTVTGFHKTASIGRYMLRVLILALACEVPYDMATSRSFWSMDSQNPVWAVLTALVVLSAFRLVDPNPPADSYKGTTLAVGQAGAWVIRIVVVLAAFLWISLLCIGLRLGRVNEGIVFLAMVIVFDLLHRRENTMMYTAALLGAVLFLTPAFGVIFLHFRSDRLGYTHKNTKWAFYIAYFVLLLVCGGLSMML